MFTNIGLYLFKLFVPTKNTVTQSLVVPLCVNNFMHLIKISEYGCTSFAHVVLKNCFVMCYCICPFVCGQDIAQNLLVGINIFKFF